MASLLLRFTWQRRSPPRPPCAPRHKLGTPRGAYREEGRICPSPRAVFACTCSVLVGLTRLNPRSRAHASSDGVQSAALLAASFARALIRWAPALRICAACSALRALAFALAAAAAAPPPQRTAAPSPARACRALKDGLARMSGLASGHSRGRALSPPPPPPSTAPAPPPAPPHAHRSLVAPGLHVQVAPVTPGCRGGVDICGPSRLRQLPASPTHPAGCGDGLDGLRSALLAFPPATGSAGEEATAEEEARHAREALTSFLRTSAPLRPSLVGVAVATHGGAWGRTEGRRRP